MTTLQVPFTGADTDEIGVDVYSGDLVEAGQWGGASLWIDNNQAAVKLYGFGSSWDRGGVRTVTPADGADVYIEADWLGEPGEGGDHWRMHVSMLATAWDAGNTPGGGDNQGGADGGHNVSRHPWYTRLNLANGTTVLTYETVSSLATGTDYGTVRLEDDGAGGLEVFVDGVSTITWTDTGTLPTGRYFGIHCDTARFDNLDCGDAGGSPPAWDGSYVRLANGTQVRVRMANGDKASVRLANGDRL